MQTIGQMCAEACGKAAREARQHGIPFAWSDTAAIIDAIVNASIQRKAAKREKRLAFVPPTPEEVTAYSLSIEWPLDGEAFVDFYLRKNWCLSGSTRMACWRSACRYWKRSGFKGMSGVNTQDGKPQQRESISLGALQIELKKVDNDIAAITNPGGTPWPAPLDDQQKTRLAKLREHKAAMERRCREMTA